MRLAEREARSHPVHTLSVPAPLTWTGNLKGKVSSIALAGGVKVASASSNVLPVCQGMSSLGGVFTFWPCWPDKGMNRAWIVACKRDN